PLKAFRGAPKTGISMIKRRYQTWFVVALTAAALQGCDRPVTEFPHRVVTAYSASPFALDLAFDRPLSRTGAEVTAHYSLLGPGGEPLVPIRAALIDTLFGQTVRLFFPLGALEDSSCYWLKVAGLQDAYGEKLFPGDSATVQACTGLG